MAAAGFLSRYVSGPLPYVWRHIIVNKTVAKNFIAKVCSHFVGKLGVMMCCACVGVLRPCEASDNRFDFSGFEISNIVV